jgi:GT2 family glycosyltransferase
LAEVVRNCSAVTAACMIVPKSLFLEVEGFDERLRVEFNDIDLCLRIGQRGYRIVYTPEAVLYHYENATRKGIRSPEDEAMFASRWGDVIRRGDPYYNPHLTRSREDWSLNI